MESSWNSLEIVKLIIEALTPIIGGIIAWRLAKIGKDLESKQWTDRKIIEKRLEVYEKVVPALNDLYCFFMYVGNWKEITPPQAIDIKRMLDKNMHIYTHLFNNNLFNLYQNFINQCFQTYTGKGHDAKLKTDFTKRAKFTSDWQAKWEIFFSSNSTSDSSSIKESYNILLVFFRKELELDNNS